MGLRLLICLFVFLSGAATAKNIQENEAIQAVESYLVYTQDIWENVEQLLGQPPKIDEVRLLCSEDTGILLGYVTTLDPFGFVVTSADSSVSPIIAHSFRSNFSFSGDPGNMMLWVVKTDLEDRLDSLKKVSTVHQEKHNQHWQHLISGNKNNVIRITKYPPNDYNTPTGGWIKTTWKQRSPYNRLCPIDPSSGQRSATGCVATNMTQILNYWADRKNQFPFWPFSIPEDCYTSKEYNSGTGVKVIIDFNGTAVDGTPSFDTLNDMLDYLADLYAHDYSIIDVISAPLFLACGISLQINYSSHSSGGHTQDIGTALMTKFAFERGDHKKYNDDPDAFLNTLSENMINGQPAALGIGKDEPSPTPKEETGHSISCDGYLDFRFGDWQLEGYHLNYGWGADSPDDIQLCWWFPARSAVLPDGSRVLKGGVLNIVPPGGVPID